MTNKVSPELKTELVQLASNIKHFVDAFNEGNDDRQMQSLTSTGLVPKFLSDLVKDKLILAQDTCDFDISEMNKQFALRGPKYDLTSDIKDNGKVYQSFKTSNSYTEDYEEVSYSEGYLSGSNGRLLIKEDMPILYKALSDYRKGYNENSIDEEKAYKVFCKQNDVDPDALYRGDLKGFEIKNQAIKDSVVHQERTEFMDKFGFDKVCKDIEKSLKEHFVIENKKVNKNTI